MGFRKQTWNQPALNDTEKACQGMWLPENEIDKRTSAAVQPTAVSGSFFVIIPVTFKNCFPNKTGDCFWRIGGQCVREML